MTSAPKPKDAAKEPARGSLHWRILNDVREKILSGAWPPGHRIPFETEMAAQYGCSRMTVNKALTQLTRSGLLDRNRKSGTFVSAPSHVSAAMDITNIRSEVESTGKRYGHHILRDTVRGAIDDDLDRIDATGPDRIRDLACLHFADDVPFCFESRLINVAAVPESETADFSITPPGAWLLKTVPWNTAEHRILAQSADADLARVLRVDPGAACLVVERRTQNDTGPVTWARLVYVGAGHTLYARFTPSEAG